MQESVVGRPQLDLIARMFSKPDRRREVNRVRSAQWVLANEPGHSAQCGGVEGDLVVMNLGGKDGAGIVAFDKTTGNPRWKATDTEASYSSPVAATFSGRRRLLVITREDLVAIDPVAVVKDRDRNRRPPSMGCLATTDSKKGAGGHQVFRGPEQRPCAAHPTFAKCSQIADWALRPQTSVSRRVSNG